MAGQQTNLAASSGVIRHVSVLTGRALAGIYKQSAVFAQVGERRVDGGARCGMDCNVQVFFSQVLGVFYELGR